MNPFKLALIQMEVRPGQAQWNLDHASDLVRAAASQGATVVLLPEALPFGWTDPSAVEEAEPIPDGKFFQYFKKLARETGLYLCAGLVERSAGELYNAAILLDPRGHLLLRHRKLNELDIAHHLYQCGTELRVAQTELGTIGVMICADGFAPGQFVSRALCHMGAEIILSPSAWAVPAGHDNRKERYGQLWLDNYQPVAKKFGVWIASASNVGPITGGPWRGRKCIGCSLVIGPKGQVAVRGPYGISAEKIILCRPAQPRSARHSKTAPMA